MTNQANKARLGYVGAVPGAKAAAGAAARDSDSWFTPAIYIEAARRALGNIDLDPFSSDVAQRTVGAACYLTAAHDALHPDTAWADAGQGVRLWMNPPYSAKLIKPAVARLARELDRGAVGAGIVLVNNATDTQWFHELLDSSQAVCFTRGRIAFENFDGKRISGNTRGQAFVLVGEHADVAAFRREFAQFGSVMMVR